jgi:dihydroorotate dehydrogenase
VPVNACGGISTASDAAACLDAGATTVQLYTGLIYRGPGVVGQIAHGLAARSSTSR